MLEHLLIDLKTDELRPLVAALCSKPRPARKQEMAEALHRVWLTAPGSLLALLSDAERLLLAECAHGGSCRINHAQLLAKHGVSVKARSGSWYEERNTPGALKCFVEYSPYGDAPRLLDGVDERLRELLPKPPPLRIESVAEAPPELRPQGNGESPHPPIPLKKHESESVAPVELRRMLQLVAADRLSVSEATAFPTASSVKVAAEVLVAPELDLAMPADVLRHRLRKTENPGFQRAFVWHVLLQQCGWAKAKAGRLVLTPSGRALRQDFSAAGMSKGIEAWTNDENFDELRRVAPIKGQGGRVSRRYVSPLQPRRRAILETLRILPCGRWVAHAEAYRVLLALGLKCDLGHQIHGLYVGDARYGSLAYYPGGVARVYFRQTVCESLATLGLVDLAYRHPHSLMPDFDHDRSFDVDYMTDYDGVRYLRVTPLGRFLLGLDATYELPEPPSRAIFKVLPNLEVVVTDSAAFSVADAAQLARFADCKSDAVWRLGAGSILRALEAGDTADGILALLRAGSGTEIPPTVATLLRDTLARAGAAVSQEPGVLVTFRDDETAALVANDTAAAKTIASHTGSVVAVRGRNLKAFQTALRNLGILLP